MNGKKPLVDHQWHAGGNRKLGFATDGHSWTTDGPPPANNVASEPPAITGNWWHLVVGHRLPTITLLSGLQSNEHITKCVSRAKGQSITFLGLSGFRSGSRMLDKRCWNAETRLNILVRHCNSSCRRVDSVTMQLIVSIWTSSCTVIQGQDVHPVPLQYWPFHFFTWKKCVSWDFYFSSYLSSYLAQPVWYC